MTMIDENFRLLDSPVVSDKELATQTRYDRTARTIVHPPDATVEDQMRIIEASGTLDFWDDPSQDIYSESDGDAV